MLRVNHARAPLYAFFDNRFATDHRYLFLPLMVGAVVAGYLPLFSGHLESPVALPSLIPGFAVILGLLIWWSSGALTARYSSKWVALSLGLLFLLPSYQLGWLTLLLLSIWLWFQSQGNTVARRGLLLIAVAVSQPLLVTYLLKWFAGPMLSLDAALVAGLLQTLTGVGSHVGNLVYGPADHQLLILRGCSSLTNLGSAWLAWYAISRFRGTPVLGRELTFVSALTVGMLTLNLARLYGMAIDLEWHQWWHSASGEMVYQSTASVLLLIAIYFGGRYVGLVQTHDR